MGGSEDVYVIDTGSFSVHDLGMIHCYPISLTDRFATSMDGLYRAVATRLVGIGLPAALVLLICGRLRRIENRVLWLIAAIREGRVRGGWACPGRTSAARAVGVRPPVIPMPRGFAWLVRLVPYQAAGFGSQLQHLFGDPEFVALLAATPQLRKALRPLCRMLGIETALVTPAGPVVPDVAIVPEEAVISGDGTIAPCEALAEIAVPLGGRGDGVVRLGPVETPQGSDRGGVFWWIM